MLESKSTGRSRETAKVSTAVSQSAGFMVWLRQLRVHQYVKNSLVLVPVITAHHFTYTAISFAVIAFAAFSLCASAVYIVNDLVDIEADRQHPKKKLRPLASGAIKTLHAEIAVPVLLALAFAGAAVVSSKFCLALLAYLALTTAYSIWLKRKMLVDVVVLAMLYTIRVIAGAIAISVPLSAWLLAFSMFMFLSLALMKRYSELALRIDQNLSDPSNRNYKLGDLVIVGCLAVSSGFNAVTIFALYISSPAVQELYARPEVLWLVCPVLTYWIGRAMILAHRRMMDDDPIVFAIKDPVSRIAGALIAVLVLLAMLKK
jgi:4-hydroxybenzoate polyprenyltransferase